MQGRIDSGEAPGAAQPGGASGAAPPLAPHLHILRQRIRGFSILTAAVRRDYNDSISIPLAFFPVNDDRNIQKHTVCGLYSTPYHC